MSVSRTAYLDGLRGFAAVVVLNYHFFFSFSDYSRIGYGYDEDHQSLIQLPYVRLLYDGATGVNIFFIIAGYVCSAKALQLMGTGEYERLLRTMCSSLFRSALRLFLPVLILTFLAANAAHFGAFDYLRDTIADEGLPEPSLRRVGSWTGQMHFWVREVFQLMDFTNVKPIYPEHDQHLWSIAFEFRMRIHLCVGLLSMAFCSPRVRLYGLISLAAVYLLWNRWEGSLFFLGAALAQWDLIRQDEPESTITTLPSSQAKSKVSSFTSRLLRCVMYTIALYLMSFPIANVKYPAPGFIWLNAVIPPWYSRKEKYPKSIGVLMLLYLLVTSNDKQNSVWHRALTSRIAQHLGKVMFALYLIHGPIAHLFGYGIPIAVWSWIGKESTLSWWTGLLVGWLCNLSISLWLAEIFTREVDARLMHLVRFCEKHFIVSQRTDEKGAMTIKRVYE